MSVRNQVIEPSMLGAAGEDLIVPKASSMFISILGGKMSTVETDVQYFVSIAGHMSDMTANLTLNDSDMDGNTVTLKINGASTPVSVSFDSGEMGFKTNDTGSVFFEKGDLINYEVVNNSSVMGPAKNMKINMVGNVVRT